MTTPISSELNQGHRNALLAYYLGQYVPNSGNITLASLVQTPEDVYEYLLIDPMVNNDVQTSRVAQAMSSIQQYINGISLNMEPGYNTQNLDLEQLQQWNKGANQYAIWGGGVELNTYPENYLDPTLRASKTEYFSVLENNINQSSVSENQVVNAILQYLDDFENVANLEIVSGYMSDTDKTQSVYYLLGKTRSTNPDYYWRSVDMSKNIDNIISMGAWSEWLKVDLQINSQSTVGTPRLVFFGNREYIVWYENQISGQDDQGADINTISCYMSFLCFDGSWNAPQSINSLSSNEDSSAIHIFEYPADVLNTIATTLVVDGASSEKLYTCINAMTDESTKSYASIETYIDGWGKISTSTESIESYFFDDFSGENNKAIQSPQGHNSTYNIASISNDVDGEDYKELSNTLGFATTDNVVYNNSDVLSVNLSVLPSSSSFYQCYTTSQFTSDTKTAYGDLTSTLEFDFAYNSATVYGVLHDYTGGEDISTFNLYSTDGCDYDNQSLSISFSKDNGYWSYEYDMDGTTLNNESGITPDVSRMFYIYWTKESNSESDTSGLFTLNVNGDYSYEFFVNDENGTQVGVVENINLDAGLDYNYIVDNSAVPSQSVNFSYGIRQYKDDKLMGCTTIKTTVSFTEARPTVQNTSYIYPRLSTYDDPSYGVAEFIDFSDSSLSNIRLNTLFARELIQKANDSINELLSWDTQMTKEPPLSADSEPVLMDFNGANGLYFWELFFYMPWLIGYRFNHEGNYADAQSWYQYIFDPTRGNQVNNEPPYWCVRPLVEGQSGEAQGSMVAKPGDPDAIAIADPIHYQKAIVMAYVNNLIGAADSNYRLLTNDSLSLAKLQYCQAKDLLGPRPDVKLLNQWQPTTLAAVSNAENSSLSQLEMTTEDHLYAFAGESYSALAVIDNPNFVEPLNTQLLGYWNLIDSRLYKLRHNLSIDGQPISVPLYAAPVNPTLLMQQNAQGGSLSSAASGLAMAIPPYRFRTMLQSAQGAVNTLSQFGQTLLSYYERGDSANLQQLQQQQALDLSAFTTSLQQQSIDALNADQTALQASKSLAQQRYDHYYTLYSGGTSAGEVAAMTLRSSSSASMAAASPFITAGMAMKTIPNIFGLADGGQEVGAPTLAAGMVLQLTGEVIGLSAQLTETSEQYRRRSEEWKIQYQQAQSEVNGIDKQLDALAIRQQAALTALQQAQAGQANLQATLSFLTTRFTQFSLYNWLTGQLSALYYQAYDAVLSLCLSAQACWQYEMGDITTTFIQTSAWNDSYHGLLVGETLALNLQQMESAWLSRNQRRLELTKTLSLKQLLGDGFAGLTASGKISFSLNEALYDNDYPGHYLRQIKCLTLSLPALVGPYQDVRATLTQTSSSTLLKADITGVNYLNDSSTGSAANIIINPRANQQIAVSSGLNDSGLFELNFGDERYLPFEGTGAVSTWQLAFPNYTSEEQQALLASLNDVIVQVHYTALYGGASFEQAVTQTL